MHENYDVYVTRVIDGDTFIGEVQGHILGIEIDVRNQYFRLDGLNAKEIRGEERAMGLEAKDFLERWILNKSVQVKVSGKEKYGRWLTTIFIGGINVNEEMIKNGFAEKVDYK